MSLLNREGLSELGEETLSDLIAHPPQRAWPFVVRMTSGTTGRAPLVIANENPKDDPRSFEGSRRLMICLGGNNTRLANIVLLRGQRSPIRVLVVDDRDMVPQLGDLLADFAPDSARGFSSFVVRVGAAASEAAKGVKLLKLSGEKWTPSLKERFAEVFPQATPVLLYIANEIGPIASRVCQKLPDGHYHPEPGVGVDIHEPDYSGAGDILISKTFYRNKAVLRYQIGDVGRIGAICACGRPTFELAGRRGSDYIKVAGALLVREEFDRVAGLCAQYIEDYRVSASLDGGKGKLVLTVRSRIPWSAEVKEVIARTFSDELFLTQTRTLGALVAAGHFVPLVVEPAEAPFAAAYKDVKLIYRAS